MTTFFEALFRTFIVAPLVVMMLALVFSIIILVVGIGMIVALFAVALAVITGEESFKINYNTNEKDNNF